MFGWRSRFAAPFALCAVLGSASLCWPQPAVDEYEVKAAYLYKFTPYIEWPKDGPAGDDEFHIGVLGKDNFGPHLHTLARTKTVKDKKIVIHHFKTVDDYRPCHILFVSAAAANNADKLTAEERLAAAVKKANASPVLLVAEKEGHARKGAVISFYLEANFVRFEINPDTAKQAGLQVSSKLLQVGRIVKNDS